MSVSKLPNLGSRGWGKSLNDYIEDIGDRISSVEHDLNEAREQEKVFNISSGVVGFNGRMMRIAYGSDPNPGEHEIYDGEEITQYGNYNQFFWRGDVFFKDMGNGTPVYKTIDNDGVTYWDIEAEPTTGWTPVYLKIEELDAGLSYLMDSDNAYLTHPLVILLGFIVYVGGKKYWHYKTSKSDESTYAKRFMLTRPLAKFNSTFDVKSNGGRSYTITGKQTGSNNPILTLNAMGINYYYTNLTEDSLEKGLDYKEFEISTNIPIIISDTGSFSAYYTNSTFTTPDTLNKRYIHRVFFSNVGRYVLQSEQYNSNKGTDFSTVVSYGFDNIYSNFERYGDLVEIFRFVTEGTEENNDLVKVYQAIGNGIPPVDNFGINPEVNYISREVENNIRFQDAGGSYFTLAGRNYGVSPKTIYMDFAGDEEEKHNLLLQTTIFNNDYVSGVRFASEDSSTVYSFSPSDLRLQKNSSNYIKIDEDNNLKMLVGGGLNIGGVNDIFLDSGTGGVNVKGHDGVLLSSLAGNITLASNNDIRLLSGERESLKISGSTGNINILTNSLIVKDTSGNSIAEFTPNLMSLKGKSGNPIAEFTPSLTSLNKVISNKYSIKGGGDFSNDSLELVFLNEASLYGNANLSIGPAWGYNNKYYFLECFPLMPATLSFTVGSSLNYEVNWSGSFPTFASTGAGVSSYGLLMPAGDKFLFWQGSSGSWAEAVNVHITNFIGWAWKINFIGWAWEIID